MKFFNFKPVLAGYWLSTYLLEIILSSSGDTVEASLDLGLTFRHYVLRSKRSVKLLVISEGIYIDLERLRRIVKGRETVYYSPEGASWSPIAVFHRGKYYRLRAVGAYEAPTLEISGIHMHNIKHTTPWRDAERKVSLLRVGRGDRLLEIGTGLGYTAIHSARRGADVLSIEKDEVVLKIASYNPWSRELSSRNIKIILGDASIVVRDLPGEAFDKVLHDPPRFALAGELYSRDFYAELFRVLRRGGYLFHYTGAPKSRRGVNLQKGVVRRLREVGFTVTRVIREYGVLARKL